MKKLKIIKIGGNVINQRHDLNAFLTAFAEIKGPKILVHGGGKIASELAETFNIEPKMVNGRRITDEAMLDIAVMSYAGLLNKNIVAKLQSLSCNALGLSGSDGNFISCHRRPVKEIDYGFVGDCHENSVNIPFTSMLLDHGITPVCSAITHDGKGDLLNTNADTIAASLAAQLSLNFEVELIYCFELPGLMKDLDDANSMINEVDENEVQQLKEAGIIHSGMFPKIDNCLMAVDKGAKAAWIRHWKDVQKEAAGTKVGVAEWQMVDS